MIPTVNLTRFVHNQERKFPGETTGELSDLLNSIALGVKIIANLVATAGFKGLSGYSGTTNVQGEQQAVLDNQSDEVLVEILGSTGHFGLMVSEERDSVIGTMVNSQTAKYVVAFDPLDGSSNLSSNIPVGTIFTIFRKRELNRPAELSDFLQSGRNIVAAGYAVYGCKTTFVYSSGNGVHGFTLDPSIGEFLLTDELIQAPEKGKVYSVNEGNAGSWNPKVAKFVSAMKEPNKDLGTPFSARYAGSLVADFDRNMKNGGIYLYPEDKKNPRGKLRMLYECMPLAFIMEQAGGLATDGEKNILDIVPHDIHERAPLYIGTKREVEWFMKG